MNDILRLTVRIGKPALLVVPEIEITKGGVQVIERDVDNRNYIINRNMYELRHDRKVDYCIPTHSRRLIMTVDLLTHFSIRPSDQWDFKVTEYFGAGETESSRNNVMGEITLGEKKLITGSLELPITVTFENGLFIKSINGLQTSLNRQRDDWKPFNYFIRNRNHYPVDTPLD
jgi:hypothetical protein